MTAERPDDPTARLASNAGPAPDAGAPAAPTRTRDAALRRLVRPLRLTRLGLAAERASRAFWPLWSVLLGLAAALFLGLHETAPAEAVWALGGVALAGAGWFAVAGLRRFRWPSRADAVARLDATLPGRPLQALDDVQAVGAADAASAAVWAAHVRRMAARAEGARAVAPDLNLAPRDPFALRYVALTALVAALLFGSVWRAATVTDIAGGGGAALASGPAWEGWIEPPLHTGRPSLYLNDIAGAGLTVPEYSRVTLRLYGEVGALEVVETVSGRPVAGGPAEADDPAGTAQTSVLTPKIRWPSNPEKEAEVPAAIPQSVEKVRLPYSGAAQAARYRGTDRA